MRWTSIYRDLSYEMFTALYRGICPMRCLQRYIEGSVLSDVYSVI